MILHNYQQYNDIDLIGQQNRNKINHPHNYTHTHTHTLINKLI